MTDGFQLHQHPVFEPGVFDRHPELFDRFARQAVARLEERFLRARRTLPADEETLTWPLLLGPGFCGGTHPGADNVFVETMVGFNDFVYDSDCLYANPTDRIFAVSDPPGITESSRKLFAQLDRRLRHRGAAGLEAILNDLNREISGDDAATLALISFPAAQPGDTPRAVAYVAGDSLLFHGNVRGDSLAAVEGIPGFFGFPGTYISPIDVRFRPGDFFIIASDGVMSIRGNDRERRLADVLLQHVNGNPQGFALSAMRACNACIQEQIYDRTITRFGGSDNVTVMLVVPEELPETGPAESYILGGSITRRRK